MKEPIEKRRTFKLYLTYPYPVPKRPNKVPLWTPIHAQGAQVFFSCLALFAHRWHGQGILNVRCLSSRKTRGTFIICGTHFSTNLYLKAEKMGFFSKTWRCSVWVSHQQKHTSTRARFDTVHSPLSSINRRTYASSTRSLGMCKLTLYSLTF